MAKSDYSISNIYQGGYSSLKPNYTGPSDASQSSYITAGSLGLTTDPRTANVLQEVSSKLSSGVKNIDVTAVSPQVFDAMPKQHLNEINRLAKLTGVDISMHGPVMDVAGFTRQGFNEAERENSERMVVEALMRAKELKPDGNIPVNFHTAEGFPSSQFLPPKEREKAGTKYKQLLVVNRDSGQMAPLEKETEYYPGGKVIEKTRTPESRIESLNRTDWENSLFQIEVNRENAARILQDVHPVQIKRFIALNTGNLNRNEISEEEYQKMAKIASAREFIEQANLNARSIFSKAYEMAKEDNDIKKMEALNKISENYGKISGIQEGKITKENVYHILDPQVQAFALQNLIHELKDPEKDLAPNKYVELEKFATEKTAKTFGNAAFQTYKKMKGKNVPILNIENPPAGFGLSTGEDVKNVVEKSRKVFVENAMKEGMSKHSAEKEAEKLIGATWDVGHINMLRKHGYTEEDIVKESEKVKDVLHMVHLSDNFGFEHTELPMGMGNVPFKEIMAKLGQKGFEAKKIIEAGHWFQHFKSAPVQETLEAFGSPIYGMKMAPYWNQTNQLQEGYFGGYGQMLPQGNYAMWGSGFSMASLPMELGGQRPGAQGSRMSGRPME